MDSSAVFLVTASTTNKPFDSYGEAGHPRAFYHETGGRGHWLHGGTVPKDLPLIPGERDDEANAGGKWGHLRLTDRGASVTK